MRQNVETVHRLVASCLLYLPYLCSLRGTAKRTLTPLLVDPSVAAHVCRLTTLSRRQLPLSRLIQTLTAACTPDPTVLNRPDPMRCRPTWAWEGMRSWTAHFSRTHCWELLRPGLVMNATVRRHAHRCGQGTARPWVSGATSRFDCTSCLRPPRSTALPIPSAAARTGEEHFSGY